MIYEPRRRDSRSRRQFPRRRNRLHLARRRLDERGRVLGSGQRRVHQAARRCSSSSKTTATRSRCRSKSRRRAAISRRSSGRSPDCTSTRSTAPTFSASLRAMREAAAYVRARKGPALVHAHVIRPYSHSLSDDERLYKTPAEREAEARRDPIPRFADFLESTTAWPPTTTSPSFDADIEREIDEAAQEALKHARPAKDTAALLRLSRRTSTRRLQRSRRRPVPKASPRRWSMPSTAR